MESVERLKAEKLRQEVLEHVDRRLQGFLKEVFCRSDPSNLNVTNGTTTIYSHDTSGMSDVPTPVAPFGHVRHDSELTHRRAGKIPPKFFTQRDSLLTDLLRSVHIRTIYNIFVAVLALLILNAIAKDLIEHGSLDLKLSLIFECFGKFSYVVTIWSYMLFSVFIVYPVFKFWASRTNPMHVEEEVVTDSNVSTDVPFAGFSEYLYFLFAPTLIYRDSYPRTESVCWEYVFSNLLQVLGCVFYCNYIVAHLLCPVFQGFNQDHLSVRRSLLGIFNCVLPGTLCLLMAFFAVLHSWLNAFAEMLRFGDRMFYKDWWNSQSFSNFYRTWNVVVHDWLYSYVYRDLLLHVGVPSRHQAMLAVFLLSAIVHEYIIIMALRFFYPVMFIEFFFLGVVMFVVTGKFSSRGWNVFTWFSLFLGTGIMLGLYSMEYYARLNCLPSFDGFWDYMIPRSWTCVSLET